MRLLDKYIDRIENGIDKIQLLQIVGQFAPIKSAVNAFGDLK